LLPNLTLFTKQQCEEVLFTSIPTVASLPDHGTTLPHPSLKRVTLHEAETVYNLISAARKHGLSEVLLVVAFIHSGSKVVRPGYKSSTSTLLSTQAQLYPLQQPSISIQSYQVRLSTNHPPLKMRLTHLTPLALATTTLSAPSVTIHNTCAFPVWVTSVSSTTGPTSSVAPSTYWTQEEFFNRVGTAVKITRGESDLWTARPVLQLSYTYKANESIYYGLSSANGFAFWGEKISVQGDAGKGAPGIEWVGEPKPDQTLAYFGTTGLTVHLCVH
jgi:hypothetical protein